MPVVTVLCAVVLCSVLLPVEGQVVSNRGKLWQEGIVRFRFASSVSAHLRSLLREAMNEWEDRTCLRFLEHAEQRDYVEFSSEPNLEHCTSDVVGRQGGRQVVVLGYSCQSKGELLHTLGHVIGFWNEHVRPDRNQFVTIRTGAIQDGQIHNFEIPNAFAMSYEGVGYSYASIMHLGPLAFSKDGSPTIEVKQAGAVIGQRAGLDGSDITRVRRLYQCPGLGRAGILTVHILNAVSLTITDDPRVEVRGVDDGGVATTFTTSVRTENRNPTWNEIFRFPVPLPKWQFIRVHVQGVKKSLGMPVTVPVLPGSHPVIKHCIDATHECLHHLNFRYTFLEDGDECSPHPCNSNGECVDGFVEFQCNCVAGYSGRHCQDFNCDPGQTLCQSRTSCTSVAQNACLLNLFCHPSYCCSCAARLPPGRELELRVDVINARNLPDLDPDFVFTDRTDPYVEVSAFGLTGRTEIVGGTFNPDFNNGLVSFGCRNATLSSGTKFTITAIDDDEGPRFGDDTIGSFEVDLSSENNFPFRRERGIPGTAATVTFEVYLQFC